MVKENEILTYIEKNTSRRDNQNTRSTQNTQNTRNTNSDDLRESRRQISEFINLTNSTLKNAKDLSKVQGDLIKQLSSFVNITKTNRETLQTILSLNSRDTKISADILKQMQQQLASNKNKEKPKENKETNKNTKNNLFYSIAKMFDNPMKRKKDARPDLILIGLRKLAAGVFRGAGSLTDLITSKLSNIVNQSSHSQNNQTIENTKPTATRSQGSQGIVTRSRRARGALESFKRSKALLNRIEPRAEIKATSPDLLAQAVPTHEDLLAQAVPTHEEDIKTRNEQTSKRSLESELKKINEKLDDLIDNTDGRKGGILGRILSAVLGFSLLKKIPGLLSKGFKALVTKIGGLVAGIAGIVTKGLKFAGETIAKGAEIVAEKAKAVGGAVVKGAKAAGGAVVKGAKAAGGAVGGAVGKVGKAVGGAVGGAVGKGAKAVGKVGKVVLKGSSKVVKAIPGVGNVAGVVIAGAEGAYDMYKTKQENKRLLAQGEITEEEAKRRLEGSMVRAGTNTALGALGPLGLVADLAGAGNLAKDQWMKHTRSQEDRVPVKKADKADKSVDKSETSQEDQVPVEKANEAYHKVQPIEEADKSEALEALEALEANEAYYKIQPGDVSKTLQTSDIDNIAHWDNSSTQIIAPAESKTSAENKSVNNSTTIINSTSEEDQRDLPSYVPDPAMQLIFN